MKRFILHLITVLGLTGCLDDSGTQNLEELVDPNNPVPVLRDSIINLDENISRLVVGQVEVVNQGGSLITSYAITSGTDADKFSIDSNGTISTTINTLNYETQSSFSFNVTATSEIGTSNAKTITIILNNKNEPILTNGTFHVDENTSDNAIIGNFVSSQGDSNISCIEVNGTTGYEVFSVDTNGTLYLASSGTGACNPSLEFNPAKMSSFSNRSGHQTVVFNNRLFIIGGSDSDGYKNDVWSSSDGVIWTQETASASFSARSEHQVVVFNNKMYLIGGFAASGIPQNDVWSSSDGVTWVEEIASAAFSIRSDHQVVVFNNKMYLIGGMEMMNYKNDVWSSSDGITWVQETSAANFGIRSRHQVVVFNNKMWLIAGDDAAFKNDVWSSSDGITWVQETAAAAFSARYNHQVVVFNNKLWLLGGFDVYNTRTNDVWSSTDGINWTEETVSTAFSASYDHQVVVFNNKLWLLAGYDTSNTRTNNVWTSGDVLNWENKTPSDAFSKRHYHQVINYNNKMYLIDGYGSTYAGNVWSSIDGVNWTLIKSGAAFGSRQAHQVVVFNNKMFLIGGSSSDGLKNDVWSSSDGVNWTQEVANAEFSPRYGHKVVVLNNKLYLVGGNLNGNYVNDVWSSSNGRTWVEETANALFPSTYSHQVVVFNNEIFLIGGSNIGNIIYTSEDGQNWSSHNSNLNFSGSNRDDHIVIEYKNKLYLIAGTENLSTKKNDIWSSIDGLNWTLEVSAAEFSARDRFDAVVFNNHLYIVGGSTISGNANDVWSTEAYDVLHKRNGYTLDYETANDYNLTVKAYNDSGVSNTATINIQVNDIAILGE